MGSFYTNEKTDLNKSKVRYGYLIWYFSRDAAALCLFYRLQQQQQWKKRTKKKHKRKRLNGWCPLGHNDKLWYDIKMPPSLLQKSDQATLQLWQRDLSSRIFLPIRTQLVCSTAPVQCWHRPDGIENKGKRRHNTDLAVLLSSSSSSSSSSSVRGIYLSSRQQWFFRNKMSGSWENIQAINIFCQRMQHVK